MEVLPPLGHGRRCSPAREYGSLRGKQLLDAGVLEKLAQELQFMGYTVDAGDFGFAKLANSLNG